MSALHVVSHRRWIADDFSKALPNLDVIHSFGFDLPDFRLGDAVWAPMEWMSRARLALGDCALDFLPLVDPGPDFLTRLPQAALGRVVDVATFDEVVQGMGPEVGFYKPANMKVEALPARWCRRVDFVADATLTGLDRSAVVMWSEQHLDLVEEHRCFVIDDHVVASSPYVIGDEIWHEQMSSTHGESAQQFANSVLESLSDLPRGFVLDVAFTRDHQWVVLEANPAWSSAQYGADLPRVAECLFVANEADPVWAWRPDPYLDARARRQRVLPR